MAKNKNEGGFSAVEAVVVIFILGFIGFAGWRVINKSSKTNEPTPFSQPQNEAELASSEVRWQMANDGGWRPNGTPPECPNPLLKMSPIDVKEASEVMYPGQYRGTHYKAHGGFRIKPANKNSVTVKLPMDMRLVDLTHYMESGEIQYLLTFEHPCGIQVRFDHLLTLAPEFADIVKTLPPPTESTASQPPDQPHEYSNKIHSAGTTVATAVGHTTDKFGTGFDFGVYDLRSPNEISKNAQYAAIHQNESSQSFYAVCWLDMLPAPDVAHVKTILPLATDDRGASDYCDFDAGGSTLDYNNGQPVMSHSTPNRAR